MPPKQYYVVLRLAPWTSYDVQTKVSIALPLLNDSPAKSLADLGMPGVGFLAAFDDEQQANLFASEPPGYAVMVLSTDHPDSDDAATT